MLCFNFPINVQNDCFSGILINLGYVLLHVTCVETSCRLIVYGVLGSASPLALFCFLVRRKQGCGVHLI